MGARSVARGTAPGRLLADTSHAIGKHLRAPTVSTAVAPELMPKRNSALIGNRGRTTDDEARPGLGDDRGFRHGRCRALHSLGGISRRFCHPTVGV